MASSEEPPALQREWPRLAESRLFADLIRLRVLVRKCDWRNLPGSGLREVRLPRLGAAARLVRQAPRNGMRQGHRNWATCVWDAQGRLGTAPTTRHHAPGIMADGISRRTGVDPIYHANRLFVHLNPFDQSADDLSPCGPTQKQISYRFTGRNLMTCLGGWCMLPVSTPDGFRNSGRCVNVFR